MNKSRRATLWAFPPDAARARHLNRRMARHLAASLRSIATACSGNVAFDEGAVERTVRAIEAAPAVATPVTVAYFDLLAAVRSGDAHGVRARLEEIAIRPVEAEPFRLMAWGGPELGQAREGRYLDWINVEPGSQLVFAPVPPALRASVEAAVERAFALFSAGAPEVGAEVRELVRELILATDGPGGTMGFDGATSVYCWGALFLNAERHASAMDMVDGLAHESAHAHLFGVSQGEVLVANPPDERHPSPLRAEPRPLDGIYHAAYVSARMHYAHHRLLEAGVLDAPERDAAEAGRAAGLRAFKDGLTTLDRHARLTPLGGRVMAAARRHMAPFL